MLIALPQCAFGQLFVPGDPGPGGSGTVGGGSGATASGSGGAFGIEVLDEVLEIVPGTVTLTSAPIEGVLSLNDSGRICYASDWAGLDFFSFAAASTSGPVSADVLLDPIEDYYEVSFTITFEQVSDDGVAMEYQFGVICGSMSERSDGGILELASPAVDVSVVSGESSVGMLAFTGVDDADRAGAVYNAIARFYTATGAVYIPAAAGSSGDGAGDGPSAFDWKEFWTGCGAGAVTGGLAGAAAGTAAGGVSAGLGAVIGAVAGCVVGGVAAAVTDPDDETYNPGHSVCVGGLYGFVAGYYAPGRGDLVQAAPATAPDGRHQLCSMAQKSGRETRPTSSTD